MERRGISITAILMAIVLVILCAVGAVYHFKFYKDKRASDSHGMSLYEADGMKKLERSERVLLNELADADFQLYAEGDYIILVHEGQETEFSDWGDMISSETPDMYYYDFNGDGDKELVIRALDSIDEKSGESVYCLYALLPYLDEEGNYNYTVGYGSHASWYTTLQEQVISEMSQPISCDKRLQLVMTNTYDTRSYDTATGILTEGRSWYATALSDGKGNYYTYESWEKGEGVYYIDEEEEGLSISVRIPVYVSYSDVDTVQLMGHIYCGIDLNGSTFEVAKRSVGFSTNSIYAVSNPRNTADEPWSFSVSNNSSYSSADKIIDKLEIKIDRQRGSTDATLGGVSGDGGAIRRIDVTDSTVTLYARSGYSFSPTVLENYDYSVFYNYDNIPFDMVYKHQLTTENGAQVLTITLDKSYPLNEFGGFRITFGS